MKGSVKTALDVKAYERDNYACTKCGRKSWIESHHVVPEVEKLSNLVTLCHACHKEEHGMSGCFGQGDEKDSIRTKTQFKKGHKFRFKKGEYYNRWTNEWIGR